MRFLFLILSIFLFTGCLKHNILKTEPALNTSEIDSLILESTQYYHKYKDSIPVFDKILKQAYNLALQNNNQVKVGNILIILGKRQRNASEFAKAISYFQQAIAIADKEQNDELRANATHELAVVFRKMDDNAQAHRLYIEALEWAENANDTFLIHCSYNGIGNVYFNYENYEMAIENYHKSLNYLGKVNRNLLGEAINTNTLGESWLFLGNTDSAMFYLNRSFNINIQLGSQVGQAICYNGIGMVYHYQGNFQKAIETYKKALALDQSELEAEYISMILTSLGKSYTAIKKYTEAEKVLLKSFKISSSVSSRDRALEAITELVDLYKKTKQPYKALKYTETSTAYKDSINKELINHNSMAMNTLYKAEQQEREILILKQNAELDALKLKRQQNMIISTFVFALIIVAFALAFYRQRQLSNMVNQVELEQQLLRAQLNPHFIFNSLSALQIFFMNNDKLAASDYLANFSRLMRNILLGSRTDSISLEKELELLTDYLKLQQLRSNNTFDFKIDTSSEIDTEACLVPPMLIQPFIENSIEHGMRKLPYQGLIFIHFEKANNNLQIIVDDNGVGFNQSEKDVKNKKNQHESLATKITQERLQNLHHITKQKCSLEIINKADISNKTGVKVILTIPYKE